ncbi:DUF4397 domain-containing protein [Dactylosporangium aurantiacum]|uniref:DUF4397 domain-containing protein n=2 Tax=Dactylosporangium aurantiacum TaxID=35754 RepID=A0A9Q9IR86_9ACTN|nr:DUF4397 domain-containing protein [Dactylosporangium aurantiacum]MDG6109574.1 DUF4397 domain-containing protein [Dactylosporangium aurantiacum]UWZ59853.1 DUF4397 domain-containing protein [Dactylosporangium aurantiacum]
MRRSAAAFAALALAGVTAGVTLVAEPAYAAGPSKVSVVHGISGQPVDVYVNGKKTLDNFQPSTVAGPLDLPAGKYDIVIVKPGDPVSSPIIKVDQAAVPADANISLVAHLTADGKPTLTPFVNDTAKLGPGKARLIVRHTAAAPAVDVRAGGQPVFKNLTNPNEAKADLAAGTVSADVVLAGTTTVAIPAANLNLAEGTATIVYAVGSAEGKTLGVVAQTISGLHGTPGGVPSGDGGNADQGPAGWVYAAGAAGLLLLLAGGFVLYRTRGNARAQG